MSKLLRKTAREVSFLVNTALNSSRIKSLKLEEKRKIHPIRPCFHVIIHAPIGQLKSTILQEIAEKVGQEVTTEVTRPGLVGTIDQKTLQFVPGGAWECRNSLMILDEFSFGRKKEGWEVFLQLLESQRWGKKIGVFSADTEETDGDLYFRVCKGRITLKTRFACVVGTMKHWEFQRGQAFKAFVTRCVPYRFRLGEAELKEIAEGAALFNLKSLSPEQDAVIDRRTYSRLHALAAKELRRCDRADVREQLYLRTIGDLCRAYAVWGRNDASFMRKIVAWKVEAQESIGAYYKEKR